MRDLGDLVIMLGLVLLVVAGCARPAPRKPEQPDIQDELHCFVVASDAGAGLVCTERAAPCETIQGLTDKTEGVTGTSPCRRATVTVETKP